MMGVTVAAAAHQPGPGPRERYLVGEARISSVLQQQLDDFHPVVANSVMERSVSLLRRQEPVAIRPLTTRCHREAEIRTLSCVLISALH